MVSSTSTRLEDRCHLQPLKPSEYSVPRSSRLSGGVVRNRHKAAALPAFPPSIWGRRAFLKVGLLSCKCERKVAEHTASGLCLLCSILITVQPIQFIPTPRPILTPLFAPLKVLPSRGKATLRSEARGGNPHNGRSADQPALQSSSIPICPPFSGCPRII